MFTWNCTCLENDKGLQKNVAATSVIKVAAAVLLQGTKSHLNPFEVLLE